MRLFLSIAICSVFCVSSGIAFDGREGAGRILTWSNSATQTALTTRGIYYPSFGVFRDGVRIATWQPTWATTATNTRPLTTTNPGAWSFVLENTSWSGGPYEAYSFTRMSDGVATNFGGYWTPAPADPMATNSFTWTFGPQWAGTILSIRSTNGTTLGTWGLPSVMTSNYVLSSSIVTNASLLNGAQVFLDGVSAASLAMASTNSNLETFADRPGYEFEFDSSFAGGFWQIRRQDGSVAASGSAATLGSVVSGRVTVLPEGSQGTVWTQVAPGDGLPAQWVNSGITVQGNTVTRQYFAATGTPAPQPTPTLPQPTPAPGASPAPTPGSLTGGSSVTPTTDPSTNVSVTVTNAVVPSMDAGEQGVLDKIDSMNDKFAQGLEDFGLAYENIGLTFNEFRKLVLTPPGRTCELEFGPVSINLSSMIPGWVREASKLVFLFAGVAAMWRFITWTFSS